MDLSLVKSDYIAGEASLAQLAHKHGISLNSLYKASSREGWVALREEYQKDLTQRLVENHCEPDLAASAALRQSTLVLSNWLAEIIAQRRSAWQVDGKTELKQFRELVACLRELHGLVDTGQEDTPEIRVVFADGTEGCCK